MESHLEVDCCPTTDSHPNRLVLQRPTTEKLGHAHSLKQFDFDNRCESGYKSVDEDYQSVGSESCLSGCGESDYKHTRERIANISEEHEEKDVDTENRIKSIDEGIGSINLSTEVLAERLGSVTAVQDDHRTWREIQCNRAYQQDEDGDTHLHISIIQQSETLALHLIGLVTDPDYLSFRNNYLQTPLHLAVITKQPLLVRKLITAGAELDVRDHKGNTPLHIACKHGQSMITQLILQPVTYEETKSNLYEIPNRDSPQNLEARNYEGQVCLHLAAETGNCDILYDLISKGANINTRDGKSGRTVLHYAAESGNEELVKFLLTQEKIDVNSETYGGLTPIKLAKGRGNDTIVKMLKARGADFYSDDSSEEEEMETECISDDFAIAGKPVSCQN